MTNNIVPVRGSGNLVRRESAIVFPGQIVDPEFDARFGRRWVVWCFVFEVGLSLAIVLVWRLWSA
jgi:hypothetical protein